MYGSGAFGPATPNLAAFDAAARQLVPIAFPGELPILSLSRGLDGSLWVVTGFFEGGVGYHFGKLYSATIKVGEASLRPIALPSCASLPKLTKLRGTCPELTPLEVVARSATDVWVVATLAESTNDNVLLHSQAPPKGVATFDGEP